MGGWIAVDLDGTLAEYDGWQGSEHIGPPVPLMLERVKGWRTAGFDVRIFTARVAHDEDNRVLLVIQAWSMEHIGEVLPVTNRKDYGMMELWDDRAISVEKNTGRRLDSAGVEYVRSYNLAAHRVQDASLFLIAEAHKLNSSETTVTQHGVHLDGQQIGDWEITVKRIEDTEGKAK